MAGARPDGGAGGAPRSPGRINKTMRVGPVLHTSVGLEEVFWTYLAELAAERGVRLPALVNEVAAAKPRLHSLASALRVFALEEARRRRSQDVTSPPPGVTS